MPKFAPANRLIVGVSTPSESTGTQMFPEASKEDGRPMNTEIRSSVVSWIALFGYVMLCGLLWAAS